MSTATADAEPRVTANVTRPVREQPAITERVHKVMKGFGA